MTFRCARYALRGSGSLTFVVQWSGSQSAQVHQDRRLEEAASRHWKHATDNAAALLDTDKSKYIHGRNDLRNGSFG